MCIWLVSYWLGKTKILKHTRFLCQFYELRHLKMHIAFVGCVYIVWFGQYTEIAFLASLFGCAVPAYIVSANIVIYWFDNDHGRQANALGMAVKMYYTIRELSARAPEMFAFKAMQGEILVDEDPYTIVQVSKLKKMALGLTLAWQFVFTFAFAFACIRIRICISIGMTSASEVLLSSFPHFLGVSSDCL